MVEDDRKIRNISQVAIVAIDKGETKGDFGGMEWHFKREVSACMLWLHKY